MAGEQKRSLDRYRAKRSRSLMELAVLQRPPPTFSSVFSIGPCSEALFESFTCKQLRKLQQDAGNSELRHLVDSYLRRYPIRQADVAAGQHVALLRHHASVPGARLELPPATYTQVRGGRGERGAPAERGSARVF